MSFEDKNIDGNDQTPVSVVEVNGLNENGNQIKHTIRSLKPRHLQIMAISGTIGTGLFVGTGGALAKAGPLGLLLGYGFFAFFAWINYQAMGEMSCYLPVDGAFIHFAARFVDPAFSFGLGWLYTYNIAVIVAAEVTAVAGIVNFWNDSINNAVWCALILLSFIALNIVAVKFFGEGEFYLSLWKIFLILGLILFTFITMVGGNPQHDVFGFRYWKNPGPFGEYLTTGSLGKFAGFWSVFVQAAYALGGPDYIALSAPEAMSPRRVLPSIFGRIIYRLIVFYFLGVLCVGILNPSNDPDLGKSLAGAGSSPFVLAAVRLNIPALPSIINAALLTSAWSCGLENCFAGSRSLYSLALSGHAPAFLKRTRNGVPIYCVLVVVAVGALSFMSVNQSSATVFSWIVNICGSGSLLIGFLFNIIYIRFYKATVKQGMDRTKLPYRQRGQIYLSHLAAGFYGIVLLTNGFTVFVKGHWAIADFLFAYMSIAAFLVPYLGYKIYSRSFWAIPLDEIDLVTGVAAIEALADAEEPPSNTKYGKFNRWLWG